MSEEKVESITKYYLQENVLVEADKKEKVLGYYITNGEKPFDCYRNTKTIEQVAGVDKGVQRAVSKVQQKPCGSDCIMFQLLKKGKDHYVRLNCVKKVFLLEDDLKRNEFKK